jgi:hypothetical protein
MSSQMKSWSELTKEERDEIFKKINCEVKVKLVDGRVFSFNPFKELASMPPQYNLSWLPLYDNEPPERQFMFCDEVFRMVLTQGIETDNIDYLNEASFDTTNLQLNLNIEDDIIWTMLKNSKNARDLEDCDEEYKHQIIKGYKICKGKTYNFKSIEEEEEYFMREDVTPEEEVYYYQFVIEWGEKYLIEHELAFHEKLKH